MTHMTSLLLLLARTNSSDTDLWALVHRLVSIIQSNAANGWEVAETALPRIRILIRSMPDCPGSEDLKRLVAPPPQLGASLGSVSSAGKRA